MYLVELEVAENHGRRCEEETWCSRILEDAMVEAAQKLRRVLDLLSRGQRESKHALPSTPFALVLWEQVAYLVDDDRRAQAFASVKTKVGLTPERVLGAPISAIEEAIRIGGMHPARRATRIRQSAAIAVAFGDLGRVVAQPFAQARHDLTRFAGIGEPGAEKILLFSGHQPVLALDSNGVRVLLRLGYGAQLSTYAATYHSVQRAAAAELPVRVTSLVRAHQALRQHGQEVCRRTQPKCEVCPARELCAYFQTRRRGPLSRSAARRRV